MLFTCYGQCQSLREVVSGMRAFEGRLQGFGIQFIPARSTFAEANPNRDSVVFESYPDSRPGKKSIYVSSFRFDM